MHELFHIFNITKDLIHIFIFLMVTDILVGWVKAIITNEWNSKYCIVGLWKKISNFILLILSGVIDYLLKKIISY